MSIRRFKYFPDNALLTGELTMNPGKKHFKMNIPMMPVNSMELFGSYWSALLFQLSCTYFDYLETDYFEGAADELDKELGVRIQIV